MKTTESIAVQISADALIGQDSNNQDRNGNRLSDSELRWNIFQVAVRFHLNQDSLLNFKHESSLLSRYPRSPRISYKY